MNDNACIVIGKIVAPHGVRGDIRIKPLSDNPDNILKLTCLTLSNNQTIKVSNSRWHKKLILTKPEGIDDMDAAEKLRGLDIIMSKSDLPKLPEGRYYVFELIGLPIFDEDGNPLGTLSDVITTGAADVYVIHQEGVEDIYLPAVPDETIKQIDLPNRKMIVKLQVWE